jgi:hypothetical protein
MWICKHCGHENENNLHECWNCGTGINWVPTTDASASVSASSDEAITPPKAAPLSNEAASALAAVGIGAGLIGIIAGIIVLVNAPDAPSDSATDALTQIQRTNHMVYIVLGWSQIVGGLVTGLLLFVVGGIGQAVVDLWNDRNAVTYRDERDIKIE